MVCNCKRDPVVIFFGFSFKASFLGIRLAPSTCCSTEEFDRRWNSILSEASYRIQELLVKETHEVRDRITEEILNVEEIITAKYGLPKAEQTINKALELSTKFQEGLTHKRTKKLIVRFVIFFV